MIRAVKAILEEVQKAIWGKGDKVELLLAAILAQGHVLIDDVPGVGKTTLAVAMSKALGLEFKRIQFTPDVLPSDITGFSVYDRDGRRLRYVPGVAVQANILLGDEINRTSSKTQSALLEAMEERQITVDGQTYKLKNPFVVIATQNNVGSVGTQLLPYAQLDRFMLKMSMGYPDFSSQLDILRAQKTANPIDEINQVSSEAEIRQLQLSVQSVTIKDEVLEYIVRLAEATRSNTSCEMGISPRGMLSMSRMARARAFVSGRDYVTPSDIREIFLPVCEHRIIISREGRLASVSRESVLNKVLQETPAPDGAR